jgi:hypothetical protein
MKYEVRFQIGGEEHAEPVEADDAATAAQRIQEQYQTSHESFELIQVHLLDDMPEFTPVEPGEASH